MGVHLYAPTAPRRTSLRSRLRIAALASHVLVAVSVLGTEASLLTLALAGASGDAPETVYPAMHRIADNLLVPLTISAAVTGVVVLVLGRWNPLREWWIAVKLVATLAGAGLATFVLAPGLSNAAASATGLVDPEFLTSDRERTYALILTVQCAVLASLATLGVLKPAARRTGRSGKRELVEAKR